MVMRKSVSEEREHLVLGPSALGPFISRRLEVRSIANGTTNGVITEMTVGAGAGAHAT